MAQQGPVAQHDAQSDDTLASARHSAEQGRLQQQKEQSGHDGESTSEQPESIGFWHKDLKKVRREVFSSYWFILLILCTFILLVLSIYWASLFNAEMNLDSLIVYIVDFDADSNAIVGPALTQLASQIVSTNTMPHLGYVNVPGTNFGGDPMQVREAIYSEEAWAALVVMPNATQMLRQAVSTGNSSYDPLGACQLIYIDARDQESWYDYIQPQISQLQTQFTAAVGQKWAAEVLANQSISRSTLVKVPQAISPAIGFSTFNLRPFYPYGAVPSVTVGLIYLIILAFFAFSFFMPIHAKLISNEGHRPLHFYQFIIWRWIAAIQSYLFLSLAYSLVSLAFQIPFSNPAASHFEVALSANKFGRATFVVYWTLNFLGMTALGMACENVAMVVGSPWTSMWLIFWVITNVCTSFYPIELAPHFFYWGYAWPLHNIVQGTRTLIFDLHSRLGLNFGVLLAWCAVNTVLYPICSWIYRRKEMKAQKPG